MIVLPPPSNVTFCVPGSEVETSLVAFELCVFTGVAYPGVTLLTTPNLIKRSA